jgi:hypothetical protein
LLVRPLPTAALIDEQRDVPDILTVVNDKANMLDAVPDHYLRGLPDGRQELVETTGGSPTPTRFLVDYSTGDRLTTHAGLGYPSAYSIIAGDEIRSANIACVKTV